MYLLEALFANLHNILPTNIHAQIGYTTLLAHIHYTHVQSISLDKVTFTSRANNL